MNEGLFSKHSSLNAGTVTSVFFCNHNSKALLNGTLGAIPASAEELSQRYTKLFQQYSR